MFIILGTHYRRGLGVPDYAHGDVYPGPYATYGEAYNALLAYVGREIAEVCRENSLAAHKIFKLTEE
jgi:hypothetical protein